MRHFWKSSQSLIEIEKFLLIFFWQKVFFFWSRFFHLDVINVGNLHKSDISRLFHLFPLPQNEINYNNCCSLAPKRTKKVQRKRSFRKKVSLLVDFGLRAKMKPRLSWFESFDSSWQIDTYQKLFLNQYELI